MSKRIHASGAALLVAIGVAIAAGGVIGHALASRPGTASRSGAPRTADEARRAIAAEIRTPPTIENAERLAHLLAQLGPEAVPAIAPTLADPSETLDPSRALLLIQFWVDRDPPGAAKWASSMAPLAYRLLALALAVERLAETDPGRAVRFVGRGPGANAGPMKPLIRGWVRSDKPGVEEWIRELGYGFARQKALGAFARAKIEHEGAQAAIAWVEALPESDDGFKRDAFWRMTKELTYADPATGVAWYEKHRDGPYGEGMLMTVAAAWAVVDGPSTMRWVSQQPASSERDLAVVDSLRAWATADYAALERWTRAMGPDRSAAWFQPGLPILAKWIAGQDPLEGIRWTEAITDEPTRSLTRVQIARDWLAVDAAAAEAWLVQSPLSEEERAKAREPRTLGRKKANPAPSG